MVLIYIYYDGSQYKDIFLLHEIFNDKCWWVTSYEIVEWVIYLKGLFPHSNVSEFHLLSYLTPLYFPLQIHYRGFWSRDSWEIAVRTIFVELRILLLFYGIKHCIGELFWGCFVFGELELWLLWWDSRLLLSFI